jgi:hypothetical protein
LPNGRQSAAVQQAWRTVFTPRSRQSERVPSRTVGELQVAEIGPESQTDTRADWNHDDIVRGKRRHAEAANEIGRAVDAAEAIENRSDLNADGNISGLACARDSFPG